MRHQKPKSSQQLCKIITESISDYAIFTLDKRGIIDSWNPGVEKILGYKSGEFVGENFQLIFTQNDLNENADINELLNAEKNGKTEDEKWHKRKNGELFWASGILTAIKDIDGELTGFVKVMRDTTRRKNSEKRIHDLAYFDQLTGLPNRLLFNQNLNEAFLDSEKLEKCFAIFFIDLDRFKFINDTLGHKVGDELLKQVGVRLKSCVKTTDIVSRRGGDEFTILLKETKNNQEISNIAQRIIALISEPFLISNQEIHITPSIGISVFPIHANTIDDLVVFADVAMYSAKKKGGGTFKFYNENAYINILRMTALEKDLRGALKKDEFVLYYQPKLDLNTCKIEGMEALIRWKHPRLGLLTPNNFIQAAERSDLIKAIGEWVLLTACRQTKKWQEEGLNELRISINVSLLQINKSFANKVKKTLEETQLDPKYLELEITETDIMQDNVSVVRVLEKLKKLGVIISIDDFGTGYSSLSRLGDLPIDILKIDRSFISNLNTNPKNPTIIKSIVAIGQSLHLDITAEGVETEDQIKYLKQLHCNNIQGYFVSPPLPEDKFVELIKTHKNL